MISHVSGAECHAYTWHCRASRFFNYINENLQRNKSAPILTCSGGNEEKGIHTCSVDTLSFQRCHSVFACHPILVPSAFISHWQWKSSTLANRRATLLHTLDLHFKNTATSTLILCRLPFSGMGQIVWTALDAIFNLALSRPGLPVGFGTTIQSGLFRYDELSCNLSAPHSSNIPRTKDVCSVFYRKQPRLIFPMLNAFSAPWAHPCGLAEHTKCIIFC